MINTKDVLYTHDTLAPILCRRPDPDRSRHGAMTFSQLVEKTGLTWRELGEMLIEGQLTANAIEILIEEKENGTFTSDLDFDIMNAEVPPGTEIDSEDIPF